MSFGWGVFYGFCLCLGTVMLVTSDSIFEAASSGIFVGFFATSILVVLLTKAAR